MSTQRLDLLDLAPVYLELDDPTEWGTRERPCPATMEPGPGRLAHVISPRSGGEIRSYVLAAGVLHLRAPCYTGVWRAVDRAVAQRLGARVAPYAVLPGGAVVPDGDLPEASPSAAPAAQAPSARRTSPSSSAARPAAGALPLFSRSVR